MTVTEACAEIRQKVHDNLLIELGNIKDYGLFQQDKNDPAKGFWLDQEKPLSYYANLENRVRIIYKLKLGQK